jgi:hypothetical protein
MNGHPEPVEGSLKVKLKFHIYESPDLSFEKHKKTAGKCLLFFYVI